MPDRTRIETQIDAGAADTGSLSYIYLYKFMYALRASITRTFDPDIVYSRNVLYLYTVHNAHTYEWMTNSINFHTESTAAASLVRR